MTRISLLTAGLVAMLAFAAPAAPTGAMTPTKLKGVTGPGFTISLKKGTASVRVKTLKAGKYTITVQDKSNIHNFRLKGPGLNKQITTLSQVATKTVTVTLKRGTYTYQCDPHVAQGMRRRSASDSAIARPRGRASRPLVAGLRARMPDPAAPSLPAGPARTRRAPARA